MMLDFAELQVTSNFSFLRGASHPEELAGRAAELGYQAIALTDFNTLAGIVRGHIAAKRAGIRFVAGCRLNLIYDFPLAGIEKPPLALLVYPATRAGYGNLCRLLTSGKRRSTEPGGCELYLSEFLGFQKDLVTVLVPPRLAGYDAAACNQAFAHFLEIASTVKARLAQPGLLSLALSRNYGNADRVQSDFVMRASGQTDIPLVATNDVYYHVPERRPLQDVVTCIREKCTINQVGYRLFQNAERYLKPLPDLHHLFRDQPQALARAAEIAGQTSGFSLDQLRYEYPDEICPSGREPLEFLSELTRQGAHERYPQGVPEKVQRLLNDELQLIHELQYEKYFLTCYDIVRFARGLGILCQGRGAAANSAVCFCLGITAVDPARIDLLFARFVSKERNEPPDIDIDFEHERREEVIQYIYQKYGRERSGLTCEVITYRHRSAIRDVGKALGLSLAVVDQLAKSIHHWADNVLEEQDLRRLGLNPHDATVKNVFSLTNELLGFPRHLSQHVGGFIISQRALCETVPILNARMPDRTIIEWDKTDIDELGMLKIDVLGLGMLTCIRKALEYINRRPRSPGERPLELATIPAEDPAVYDMACRADTIGVFQIESRAQVSMLPRLKPRCFYDLVIEVAIVRPGPIQGNMLHPYLKRRNGLEPVSYPDERVREILGKTLGIPIFQEQAMRLAIVLANFTPGEAEQLRRAMAAWKRNTNAVAAFKERITAGMVQNGYSLEFAQHCVEQIKGFSEYGFPESHAASFALLVYASAWIKRYYPAEFAAALLNSQPMGFYPPAQIVQDVQNHEVPVLPIDINKSGWDCSLEGEPPALRLGMRLVKQLRQDHAERIAGTVRSQGPFGTIHELWNAIHGGDATVFKASLQYLAYADAFAGLGVSRRQALWQIRALPAVPGPLDRRARIPRQKPVVLPELTRQQSMFSDYEATGLSLRAHPLSFVRELLTGQGVSTARELKHGRIRAKAPVKVAGLAIFRQRPPTAKGVVFITLEDETGITNLIIRPNVFEKHKRLIISSRSLVAYGTFDRIGDVIYINTYKLEELDLLVAGDSLLPQHP